MTRQDRKYVAVLIGAILLAVAADVFTPQPIDWTETFERDDARPYGSLVVFELLDGLFPGAGIRPVELPPFLVLEEEEFDEEPPSASYLFLTKRFAPDEAEARRLVAFAERGGHVFVAAERFFGLLADTLGLGTDVEGPFFAPEGLIEDSARIALVNPALGAGEGLRLRAFAGSWHVSTADPARTTVLGIDDEGRPNFVRVAVGAGAVYLHTVPLAFTNYHVLAEGGASYFAGAFSYLPAGAGVLWDAHYKPERREATTPLRFILSAAPLRRAYWLLVLFVVLFVLVRARRRQRIIPVVEPLRNTTVEFVRTVGRLYFRHGDHANLAHKKITYLLDYVRTHLRLPTGQRDAEFRHRVADRAGLPPDAVEALFADVEQIAARDRLTAAELARFNARVEDFYEHAKR